MAVDANIGAQSYFKIVETLRDALLTDPNITTVTTGDISEVDLDKQTIFPLAHIVVGDANFDDSIVTFSISVLLMDIVHSDNVTNQPSIYDNDNELYVLNNMFNVGNHLTDKLFKGDLYDGNTYVDKTATNAEPFSDRFENVLAGWSFNFSLVVRNNIDRCNY